MFGTKDKLKHRVFLIYGRNREARSRLTGLLQAFGLEVLDWETAISLTGVASPHAREVLEAAMRNVGAVVVLMSGDEEARLRQELCAEDERATEGLLGPQARPNVIFEAGLAFALFPSRTIVVQLGRLRPISDLAGVQYVPLDDSPESQRALVNRLNTAGCRIRSASNSVPTELPRAEAGLPPVAETAGTAAKVALFRRLKSLLPVPGMGGSLELTSTARIGEMLVLSLRLPPDAEEFRVDHWLPGYAIARSIPLFGAEWTAGEADLALAVPGPAGIHFFDLLIRQQGEETLRTIARSRCAVEDR